MSEEKKVNHIHISRARKMRQTKMRQYSTIFKKTLSNAKQGRRKDNC